MTKLMALLACAGMVSSAAGQVVYSHYNLGSGIGVAVVSPGWEVGEYVTFAGGAQTVGQVKFKIGAPSSSQGGDGVLNLNFYQNAGGAPGTLIGTFAQPLSLAGQGPIETTFSTGTLSLPASVWVSVLFVESSGGIMGVRMNTAAATVGSVSVTRAYRENGAGAWGTDPVGDWMTMEISAPASCYANCDGSTAAPVLNVNDFSCFTNLYAAGSSAANCDGSTIAPVLNVNDFTCFLNAYAVGCS
jgi:hypothetical protein